MARDEWCARVLLPALIGSSLFAYGCSGRTESGERSAYCPGEVTSSAGAECRLHADCGPGLQCVAPSSGSSLQGQSSFRLVAPEPGAPATPPPCFLQPCFTDAECAVGEVCEVPERASLIDPMCYLQNYCVPACQCLADERCRPDGHCEVIPCNDPTSRACPAGWLCLPGTGDPGSETVDPWASAAGCVRVACNALGGIQCEAGWTCDPLNAPALGPTPPWGYTAGCAPVPCDQGWTCTSDRICYADGTDTVVGVPSGPWATRDDGRTVDPHGCVQRNCEEGLQCPQFWECNVSHPDATVDGCRILSCSEPSGPDCETLYLGTHWCQPGGVGPDMYGCVRKNCEQGYPCPSGSTCDFVHIAAGPDGCVESSCYVEPTSCSGTGGMGGTAGTGGTGGNAGSAGTSTGGQVTTPPAATGEPCSVDTDCACGSCVLSVCAPRPGTCEAP